MGVKFVMGLFSPSGLGRAAGSSFQCRSRDVLSVVLVAMAVMLAPCGGPSSAQAQSSVPTIEPQPEGGAGPRDDTARPEARPGQPTINEIIVQGAERVEPVTVVSYMGMQAGDPIDGARINEALKTLFGTGLFADVTMELQGRNLIVRVVENPIINRIAFEGNDRVDDDDLEQEVQLRPRVVYTRTRVQSDVQRILDIYRRRGRFATQVEPKVIQLEQNRVDLVFEIDEGPLTGIEKISFIGNRFFSDSALREEVVTKESRWYRFLSSSDTYDPDKLTFDRELLRRFYLANGFADFRVISAVAELTEDRENFFLTFTLEEGNRYKFGEFDVVSKIPEIDPDTFDALIELESGDWYDADAVDDTVLALTNRAGDLGYAFADVRPIVERNKDEKTIDITFEIQQGARVFVERIDIRGNTRTLDEVIRREFVLVEGDAFNATKLRRSRQRVEDLNFFKAVEVNNVPGSAPDKTVVQVDVEEQSTGELSLGAGFSTRDGALAQFQIRERNLLGKGQDLRFASSLSQRRTTLDISFTEPYFLDRNLSAGIDLFHTIRDQQDISSFDSRETGFGLRLGYELNNHWSQRLRYNLSRETIENVDEDASRFVRQEEGTETISLVGQTLTYDQRNSKIDPTDGYVVSLTTDFAGLGGTAKFARTSLSGEYYYSITDDILFTTGGRIGKIVPLGNDLRLSDRFYLGGDDLRGFADGGAGPRDIVSDDALGGEDYAAGTVEVQFPLGLPEEFGLSGALFSDFGTSTNLDETGPEVRDTGELRASIGFGVKWVSPFGPIRADFAHAILKDDFDETEVFRFNFGTRF